MCVCVYPCREGLESLSAYPIPPLPSPLLVAPNQAAADLTNLLGMAHSTIAARSVQSTALTQGGTCELNAGAGSFPRTRRAEINGAGAPPGQAPE